MYMSMTGFGRTQTEVPFGTINLEISSVNHRYQDITVRLPREFAGWEPWFHQRLRRYFRRGKLQCRMELLWEPSVKRGHINPEVLASYYNSLKEVQAELGHGAELSIESLTQLPGVVEVPKFDSEGGEDHEELFGKIIDDTVKKWLDMRRAEGQHLRADVLTHLEELEKIIKEIEGKWQAAKDAAFEMMKSRVAETLESLGEQLDSARYLQEIVILTDKWDVSEEIARLYSHINKFKMTGEAEEPMGRKLDFIVQEMNREVNTLDSKVADAGIRWLAVNAKASLERVREQIQNLE
jgi:uncharacterized protein (TIGR00255 family)